MIKRQAEGVGDGGVEVLNLHFVLDHIAAFFIRFAISEAAPHTTAEHDGGEGFRVMVTTRVLVDVGRAAKLGGQNDECVLKQTTIVQIRHESGKTLVQCFTTFRHSHKVSIVSVPTAKGDLDKTHSTLNKTTRQKAPLTKSLFTVSTPEFSRLFGEVKCLQVFRLHHRHRIIIHVSVSFHVAMREGASEILVQLVCKFHACLEFGLWDASFDVLQTIFRVADKERCLSSREEACAGMATVIANENEVWQRAVTSALKDVQPSAHRRMADGSTHFIAGVHHVVSLLMCPLGG